MSSEDKTDHQETGDAFAEMAQVAASRQTEAERRAAVTYALLAIYHELRRNDLAAKIDALGDVDELVAGKSTVGPQPGEPDVDGSTEHHRAATGLAAVDVDRYEFDERGSVGVKLDGLLPGPVDASGVDRAKRRRTRTRTTPEVPHPVRASRELDTTDIFVAWVQGVHATPVGGLRVAVMGLVVAGFVVPAYGVGGRLGLPAVSWRRGRRGSGVQGAPQARRAQRDAKHPGGLRGGPVSCAGTTMGLAAAQPPPLSFASWLGGWRGRGRGCPSRVFCGVGC